LEGNHLDIWVASDYEVMTMKMKNSWRNRNGHNVQIWLTTGHSSFFFVH